MSLGRYPKTSPRSKMKVVIKTWIKSNLLISTMKEVKRKMTTTKTLKVRKKRLRRKKRRSKRKRKSAEIRSK